MTGPDARMVCRGCGATIPDDEPYPFRCPNAGRDDDVDHVSRRLLPATVADFPRGQEPNPFARYRELSFSYHWALARGVSEGDYLALVERLDAAVADVDGRGFRETPFGRAASLGEHLGFSNRGGVWIKDETGNVSGSHKARHLMGVMLHLQVLDRLGIDRRERADGARLAIASCGNAALAAAVVARASGDTLEAFIPEHADPAVVERLRALGAVTTVCVRAAGEPGDPCYHRFRQAVTDGALPFCCQGPDNGLTIDGGATLGYEIASRLIGAERPLDALIVQVGGGALASSCVRALDDAAALGAIERAPRVYTVQTEGAAPLARAYQRVAERIGERVAERIADSGSVDAELRYAATHRSEFMWPWEREPKSIAYGILDDTTYDWMAVVEGMLRTGGRPLVVGEETLRRANDLARQETGAPVDHTGSAGLAGLLDLIAESELDRDANVAVIFTGRARSGPG